MKKSFILYLILLQLNILYSENIEIGCDITSNKEESCDEGDIFAVPSIFKLDSLDIKEEIEPQKKEIKKKYINITKKLSSIKVVHQKKSLTIRRNTSTKYPSCPPSCIQPIKIKDIKTVGTLETLNFISRLKNNRRNILVDSRENSFYKKNTIPTATNIPNHILKKDSKYSDVILKLLGAKKIDKKWSFKHVHTLLIFDDGISDIQASNIIHRLLELGYPQNRLLYYHGGINNWIDAGLSTL